MNIRSEILKEHTKRQTLKIAGYISNNPKRFNELLMLFLNNEYRVTQRSAWIVNYCVQAHPELMNPHLSLIIRNLKKPVHDAVKRNTLRILQDIEIPKALAGLTADLCFKFLSSEKEAVAIKVFAMTVLFNLTKKEPELKNELKIIIEDQMPYASAAFLSRGKKILNKLK